MIKKTFDATEYKKLQNKAYSGQTTVDAQGGETIPTPLADYYMELLRDGTVLRQLFREIGMSAPTLEIPKQTGGMALWAVSQGLDMSSEGGADGSSDSTSRTTWGSVTITNYKLGVLGGYTTELQEDSLIDIGRMVVENGALAMAEGEEKAWIMGDTTGAYIDYSGTAGKPAYLFDGLYHQVPGTSPIGGKTAPDSSPSNIIDGGSDLLTFNELNDLLSRVEDQAGSGRIDTIMVPPKVLARMRNPVEFEMFQTIDKIGADKAAMLKGQVGDYYGSKIISSGYMPVGGRTDPGTITANMVTNAADGVVIGFDSRAAVIGQRRAIELRARHKFYNDLEELRWLERVAFKVMRNEWTGMIVDVKNSAV